MFSNCLLIFLKRISYSFIPKLLWMMIFANLEWVLHKSIKMSLPREEIVKILQQRVAAKITNFCICGLWPPGGHLIFPPMYGLQFSYSTQKLDKM